MKLQAKAEKLIRSICQEYKNEPTPLMMILSKIQKNTDIFLLKFKKLLVKKFTYQ